MSLHTETPDKEGWYWIECAESDEWMMAHLQMRKSGWCLLVAMPLVAEFEVYRHVDDDGLWHERENSSLAPFPIRRWIGPIGCPGGDLDIMEFNIECHEQAEAEKRAMVMLMVDHQHCDDRRGSVAQRLLLTPEAGHALTKEFSGRDHE